MNSSYRLPLFILALAALVAVFALAPPGEVAAQADDNDYVDVAVMLEHPSSSGFTTAKTTVMNHGARTAYDVEVVVHIVYPADTSYFSETSAVQVGSVSLEDTPPAGTRGADNGGGYSLRWTIPELGGLERVALESAVIVSTVVDTTQTPAVQIADKRKYPHELFGEVTTSSFESDLRKENNTDRIWYHSVGLDDTVQTKGAYSITGLSVDEPNPAPGDLVHFTIAAGPGANIDIEIAIELTDGIAVDVDSTATPPREISYAYFRFIRAGANLQQRRHHHRDTKSG